MSIDMVYESVPRVLRRTGDCLFSGANNAVILLGRDRVTDVDSGYGSLGAPGAGKGAGSIHLVVGRGQEDDLSPLDDAATVLLSAKNDPDAMLGTDQIGAAATAKSTAALRADCVRIVPRVDFKLSVGSAYLTLESDGTIVIEGNVSLGAGAADSIMRGEQWKQFWNTVTFPTPMGPSGPPPPIPDTVFSKTNRVK